jgi:regulatory protein
MLDPVAPADSAADAERLERVLAIARTYLNRRERTVGETRRQLERKGVDPVAVEQAIGALTNSGYLDDERFARVFAQDKRALEQWGSDRIRRGLLARHLDAELIEMTLAGEEMADNELPRALAVLQRRCPGPASDRSARDRALGILLRKGYDLALEAIRAHNSLADEAGTTWRDGAH